jgi:hypothetical protein
MDGFRDRLNPKGALTASLDELQAVLDIFSVRHTCWLHSLALKRPSVWCSISLPGEIVGIQSRQGEKVIAV